MFKSRRLPHSQNIDISSGIQKSNKRSDFRDLEKRSRPQFDIPSFMAISSDFFFCGLHPAGSSLQLSTDEVSVVIITFSILKTMFGKLQRVLKLKSGSEFVATV